MIKPDKTILRETKYIALVIVILSALMQAVFLVLRRWDYTVLLGNVLSASVAVLNFFFMGITIQKALTKETEDAKKMMRASQNTRNFAVFVAVVIGVLLPCFNTITTIIPIFFPRIAVMLRPLWKDTDEKEVNER